MLILIVSPSLNLRSSSCFGFSFSFSICSRFFNHLKWSWRATFRSKLSDLSKKPTPMNADRPLSSWILRTKYRDESVTGSTAIPGYCSMGHLANSSPVILSSSFIVMLSPCDTSRMRPVQDGSCRFQSAALWQIRGTMRQSHGSGKRDKRYRRSALRQLYPERLVSNEKSGRS